MIIRKASKEDAPKIIKAHIRSIRECCSRDYTSEQIAAWSGRDFSEVHWHRSIQRDLVYVISDIEDNIYGFGHMSFGQNNDAELAGLYFVPEAQGRGLGKEIVQLMMNEVELRNIKVINLRATKTALEFYKSVGFHKIEDSCITMSNIEIECIKMIKKL